MVKGTESGQTLERWAFDCAVDNAGIGNENNERRYIIFISITLLIYA